MKKIAAYTPKIGQHLLKCRAVALPALSTLGLLFFIFTDYWRYPAVEVLTTLVWGYYAMFILGKYGSASFEKDRQGNLFITKNNQNDESSKDDEGSESAVH
ncbi:MAG: hypothetical protein LBS63_04510 [Prevotellaceae bacterium]|jgi:hypothetical protein|nr:hypothetical protein [Prevotellaceae bacterium]